MPRQTFMHRVLAPADPERVWKGLQRPESWGRIGGVRNIEQPTFDESGDLTGYRFTVEPRRKPSFRRCQKVGDHSGQSRVDDDRHRSWPERSTWNWNPSEDQTAVTVAMTIESKGFMTAMLFPVITGAIASGFNDEVERFARGMVEDRISPARHS